MNNSDFECMLASPTKNAICVGFALLLVCTGCRSTRSVDLLNNRCDSNSECVVNIPEATRSKQVGRIEEFVQIGLKQNPSIREAELRIESLRHKIPQELSLPDPIVNTVTHLSPVQTAAGEQAFSLGINQKIIHSDRLATRASIVLDEITAANSELDSIKLEVAEKIRIACWQLVQVRKSIEITREDQQSLASAAKTIVELYGAGKKEVKQQDVLNIQIEQSKIDYQLSELKKNEKRYQGRLARLLHLDPRSDLKILDELKDSTSEFDLDALVAQATQTHPDIQTQIAKIRRDCKKIHLAQLANKPDVNVGLSWIATSSNGISPVANGDDALLLGVGFNLPVNKRRIRAGISEARSQKHASEIKLERLHDNAAEEVFAIIQQVESLQQTLSMIQKDILPKSEQIWKLSVNEYSTGKISYVQLIENWRAVLKYRLLMVSLQSQQQQLGAKLSKAVGQLTPVDGSKASTN